MVLPADIDGKDEGARELSRDPALPSASSSRNAGGQAMVTQGQKKVCATLF